MFCLVLLTRLFSTDISKIKFEYLTVDDGLSQGIVEEIFQDSHGYLWLGTHDGLNRYDGIQFTVYRSERNNPQSLFSNWVYCMAEDKSGKIWIGTQGLNVYDPVSDRMSRIPVNPDDPNAYHGGRVYNMVVDFDSTLWFSTMNGLVHYFPKKGIFKTYINDPSNSKSLGNTLVYNVCLGKDGRLFIAVNADPLYEYDRKNDSFIERPFKLAYFGNNNSKCIRADSKGVLYITSEFSGVHVYNPETGDCKLLDKKEKELNQENIRTSVLIINDNEVWIGTDGGGINIYNPLSGEMQYLMMDTRNNYSVASNAITKMFQDKDKNIWIGHFGAGISVWKRYKEKFESYSHNPFNPSSINKEVVTAIFEDSQGRIWVGQDGGGLSLFNPFTATFDHIRKKPGTPGTLTSDVILSITEDPDGNLLLGTYAGGLMVFDPETRRVIRSYNSQNGLASDHVWTFFKSSKGEYWFSDLRSGYGLYDPATRTIKNFPIGHGYPLSCSNSVMSINEDSQNRMWLCSENGGLCILDPKKQEKKNLVNDPGNKNSLSYNDVKSVIFIGKYAWIATNGGGLNRLDTETDSFKLYTRNEGLSSDALQGMLKDNHDNLWISSTKGLMKFSPSTGAVEVFDKSQGIQGNEFKYNAQFMLDDGRMLFGGVNGITLFHPDSIKVSPIKPDVVFTDFKVLNTSAIPGAKGSPLKAHINYTSYIKLHHKQSVFTIEFASLDYNSPSKNKFMYKLEGFDENWIQAGNRRFVTYTNLDPGKYTFLLKGSNSDGVWIDTPRQLIIRVRPAWYVTKLSIALYIIAMVLGIIWFIRRREKQTIQDKIILEQKIEEAQAELKSKTRKVEEHEEEIKRRNEEESDIRFQTEGVAKLSEIIARKRRNLEELSGAIISELIRYINASAGGIFVLDDSDPQVPVLRATGEFCLSSEKNIHFSFEPGEGNVGACFVDKQTLEFDNLPDGFIVMKSGLGSISLHYAVFVPIMLDSECVGVIEIASTEKLSELKIKLIEKAAESLASIITIIKANEKASHMLEQNNVQAEELKAQEEEMRQNMEELMATQEETQRREKGLLEQMERKEAQIKELEKALAKSKKGSDS
jgi:ligand-binding sensor domain-containing protein